MKTITPISQSLFMAFLFVCLFSMNSFSQTDFKLSEYVNPDYQWHSLDLDFGLTGNNSFDKSIFLDEYNSERTNNSFSGNLNTRYYSVKNSAYYQGSQTCFLNFSANGNGQKDALRGSTPVYENKQKSNAQNLLLGINSTNRFYNNRKRYFEANLLLSGSLNHSKSTIDYISGLKPYPYVYETQNNGNGLSVSIPLLVGTGRIEAVQDARLAVYIFDDLSKSGNLIKTPNNDEILAFSKYITETKNQRFFDSRIRKIAEITAIDSFLTVNGLKAKSDASYYTLLNDNWDNSNGPVRNAGHRFSIGLAPDLRTSFNEISNYHYDTINGSDEQSFTNKDNTRLNSWGLDAVAGYVCEKPINLYWQRTTEISLNYSLFNSNSLAKSYADDILTDEQKVTTNQPNAGIVISQAYGYYPNSRTDIQFGGSAGIDQYWGDSKRNDDPNIFSNQTIINGRLFLGGHYYFSPQLRFTVYISEQYHYSNQTIKETTTDPEQNLKKNIFGSFINAGLTYSFF